MENVSPFLATRGRVGTRKFYEGTHPEGFPVFVELVPQLVYSDALSFETSLYGLLSGMSCPRNPHKEVRLKGREECERHHLILVATERLT